LELSFANVIQTILSTLDKGLEAARYCSTVESLTIFTTAVQFSAMVAGFATAASEYGLAPGFEFVYARPQLDSAGNYLSSNPGGLGIFGQIKKIAARIFTEESRVYLDFSFESESTGNLPQGKPRAWRLVGPSGRFGFKVNVADPLTDFSYSGGLNAGFALNLCGIDVLKAELAARAGVSGGRAQFSVGLDVSAFGFAKLRWTIWKWADGKGGRVPLSRLFGGGDDDDGSGIPL
jgi:hypothetical protein